jgi:hypothetical protein
MAKSIQALSGVEAVILEKAEIEKRYGSNDASMEQKKALCMGSTLQSSYMLMI